MGTELLIEAGAPIIPACNLGSLLSFGQESAPPQCPDTRVPQFDGRPTASSTTFSPRVYLSGLLLPGPSYCLIYLFIMSYALFCMPLLNSWPGFPQMVFVSCRKDTVGHSFNGSGKLLQGFTIVLGPYFLLIAVPYGQMLVPQIGPQLLQ